MTKTSTLQREYEVVMSAFAAKMVSLPGTVNTAETPSIIGVHKRGTLKMIVIHLVSSMALLMKSKLPPRAARGSLGSLSKEKQWGHEIWKGFSQRPLQIDPVVRHDSNSNEDGQTEELVEEEVSGGGLWGVQDQHSVDGLNLQFTIKHQKEPKINSVKGRKKRRKEGTEKKKKKKGSHRGRTGKHQRKGVKRASRDLNQCPFFLQSRLSNTVNLMTMTIPEATIATALTASTAW